MENRGKRQAASIFGGMGFYIALLVCVFAAGVVGYFALLNPTSDTIQPLDQTESSAPVSTTGDDTATEVVNDYPLPVPQSETAETVPEAEPETEPVSAPLPVEAPVQNVVLVNADTPPVAEPVQIVSPLAGETVAVFSVAQLMYDETLGDWRTHDGIDIRAEAGTEVAASAAGKVLSVENDPRLGTTVVIDHENGYVTTYASLQEGAAVLAGERVETGAVIGTVGNTSLSEAGLGAHLHFSVSKDGETVDPAEFLG